MRSFLAFLPPANTRSKTKKEYPITPHTGTGRLKKIEYGLCEIVSQLMAREMAQKLLYPISV